MLVLSVPGTIVCHSKMQPSVGNKSLCDCHLWAEKECDMLLHLGTFAYIFGSKKYPGTEDMNSL